MLVSRRACQVWQFSVGSGDCASSSLRARFAFSMAWTTVAAASPSCWSWAGLNDRTTNSWTRRTRSGAAPRIFSSPAAVSETVLAGAGHHLCHRTSRGRSDHLSLSASRTTNYIPGSKAPRIVTAKRAPTGALPANRPLPRRLPNCITEGSRRRRSHSRLFAPCRFGP
jgi:hypothetical protein